MDTHSMTISILLFIYLFLIFNDFRDKNFRKDLKNKKKLIRNIQYLIMAFFILFLIIKTSIYFRNIINPIFSWTNFFILEIILIVVISEFFTYIAHYIKHKYNFLWKFHFQHHLDSRYNVWLINHTHGLDVYFFGFIIALINIWLGFSIEAVEIYVFLYLIGNLYSHSAFNYTLGFLDYLIVSPAFHRVHHFKKGLYCNLGSNLTIYDILFKTVIWPNEESMNVKEKDYGIKDDKKLPYDFWKEFFFFLK